MPPDEPRGEPSPGPVAFEPPSPEQFERHLRAHPVQLPSKFQQRAPMLGALVLVVLSLLAPGPLSGLLVLVGLGWLLGHRWWRAQRAMHVESLVRRCQEVAMQRRYPQALREAWRALPQTTASPNLHSQTVAMLSHCLDALGCYDAAIVGYDRLLALLPPGEPIALHIGVSRANAALGAERLSDADDSIRRLRGAVEPLAGTTIGAAYRLAQLAQQVRTHHFAEGVRENADLVEALRPLGVEAGYGHALMALCHFHYRDIDLGASAEPAGDEPEAVSDVPAAMERARLWWRRATLLLPPGTLLRRYPELKPLTELT